MANGKSARRTACTTAQANALIYHESTLQMRTLRPKGGQFSSELWYQDPEAWRAEDRRSGPSLSIPGTMGQDGGREVPGSSWH